MKFREGLFHIFQKRRSDGEVTDPFYLYCRLSDLCSSFEEKQKVELFYAVDRRLSLFRTLLKDAEEGKRELLGYYAVVSDLLSEAQFRKLVDCAVWAMDPMSQIPAVSPRQTPQKQVAFVQKAEESEKTLTTRTPLGSLTTNAIQPPESTTKEMFIGFFAFLFIMGVSAGLSALIVSLFRLVFAWGVWQGVIGIIGGAWIACSVAFIGYVLGEKKATMQHIFGCIFFMVFTMVNFVLVVSLRRDYRIIFTFFTLWEIGCIIGFNQKAHGTSNKNYGKFYVANIILCGAIMIFVWTII